MIYSQMANQIRGSKCLGTVSTTQNYIFTFFTFCKFLVLTNSKKSHTGDLHTGFSLGFEATSLESGTVVTVAAKIVVVSSAEVIEVDSSAEVMVEVEIIAFDDNDEDKAEDIKVLTEHLTPKCVD